MFGKTRCIGVSLLAAAVLLVCASGSDAQFKDYGRPGLGMGVKVGGLVGGTELDGDVDFQLRGYLNHGITEQLSIEAGGGYAAISGGSDLVDPATSLVIHDQFRTDIGFFDARMYFTPVTYRHWSPFAYAGVGRMRFDLDQPRISAARTPGTKGIDWATMVPLGVGAKIRLTNRISTDLTAGYTWTSTDKVDAVIGGSNDDIFWGLKMGFEFGSDPDPDRDRLFNKAEHRLGTKDRVWDTDGDGLGDGQEVRKYRTNPLVADTDGDGLSDGEEVNRLLTDPLKADTDADGLSDGDEVQVYRSKPRVADTDGDGLSDGDEVLKYRTSPTRKDTDNDGCSDGDEVNKHKTDPLKWDTDGDGVGDCAEIARGTDPLKAEVTVVKKAPLNLPVVQFAFGVSQVSGTAQKSLDALAAQLQERPKLRLQIIGHSNDSSDRGMSVSLSRANAVKSYLVSKGVAADRLETRGDGAASKVASSATAEGRAQNRRVTFAVSQ